jgi:hypothetical protein
MPIGNDDWVPYGFGLLQSIIAAVLAYISKLLRDIRAEIVGVKMDVSRHDVQLEESEKRDALKDRETERRLERLERERHP